MRYLSIFPLLLLSALAFPQSPAAHSTTQTIDRRPPNQESESPRQPTNNEQRGSEQSPFIIKVLPSEKTQNESPGGGHKGLGNRDNSWGLSDKIAVIASIVAFLQFVALIGTVLVMVLNGRRQLRAYVAPENMGIFEGNMVSPPQPARINVPGIAMLIKNSGQTPAYKVVSLAKIAVIAVQDEKIALVLPPMEERFSNTLSAGSTFSKSLWFDRPLTPTEIADIVTGARAIYLYGRIEYQDAFKKRRFTNFRYQYVGQFPPPPNAILNFSDRGNDAK
jgi:hypothetical protein